MAARQLEDTAVSLSDSVNQFIVKSLSAQTLDIFYITIYTCLRKSWMAFSANFSLVRQKVILPTTSIDFFEYLYVYIYILLYIVLLYITIFIFIYMNISIYLQIIYIYIYIYIYINIYIYILYIYIH